MMGRCDILVVLILTFKSTLASLLLITLVALELLELMSTSFVWTNLPTMLVGIIL